MKTLIDFLKNWFGNLAFLYMAWRQKIDHAYIRSAFHYLAQLDMEDRKQLSATLWLFARGNHVELAGRNSRFTLNENIKGEIYIHEWRDKPEYVSQGDNNFTPKVQWREIYRSNKHVKNPEAVKNAIFLIREVYGDGPKRELQ